MFFHAFRPYVIAAFAAAALLFAPAGVAWADEKGGLLVDIQKKIASRNDLVQRPSADYKIVDRTMSLKVAIKNTSMKPMPATTAQYAVLIQRWGAAQTTGAIERYEGSKPLQALLTAGSQSVDLGEFHIGGYQYWYSTNDQYVDRMLGWKVTILRDGQKLEFKSSSNFETLAKRSKLAH